MKFRFLQHVLLPVLLVFLMACGGNNSAVTNGGAGLLFVTAQANTTVSAFVVNLGNGALSANGNSVGTGAVPSAIAITPAIDTLFVANSGSKSISAYTINTFGGLSAASGTTTTGTTPMGLAIDPAGKFLFVANQGSSNVSVFSINGTALTPVPGSPFTTVPVGLSYPNGTLPTAVAVSNSGNFLYVANQLANFVSAFAIASTGALTPLGVPYYSEPLGTSPSGLGIQPNGGFLYVMNAGANSNNISVFAICDVVVTSCTNPNKPDGTLTEVTGSPFPAGLGPVAITFDPNFIFAYVVDKGSNSVSQYSYGTGSGVLTPLSPATISTGLTPVSIALRVGATGSNIGNTITNPTDWVYVANSGAGTISIYTLTTTTGLLNVSGMPFTTFGQTSALAAR
ncbi:MAG: beta-propeller fold lactonase family protein [Terriglobales bacterium]